MTLAPTLSDSTFTGLPLVHRGKVRDVYSVGEDQLLLVATDRLSAFDCILPTPIRFKGAVLTALSEFWFRRLAHIVENHCVSTELDNMPEVVRRHDMLRGRSMLVRRTEVFPVECVVRGYLEGSGWKDYLATGSVCGHQLPPDMKQCDRLPEVLFTPATKAVSGHDENITETEFIERVGQENAAALKSISLRLYTEAAEYALACGIIIADTKFEFGVNEAGRILLIDEALTPDSSRFWDAASYEPGHPQPSFDKQFVREYLETLEWDKTPPAPSLPEDIAEATSERYLEAHRILTGQELGLD